MLMKKGRNLKLQLVKDKRETGKLTEIIYDRKLKDVRKFNTMKINKAPVSSTSAES